MVVTTADLDGPGAGGDPAGLIVSPGLAAAGLGPAFELKFLLAPDQAAVVEAWARRHLAPDRHGDGGRYRVTSVYCDTPGLDVFHRAAGHRRTKFRVRRYGGAARVFLERKRRRGDRVRKQRTEVGADELALLAADAVRPDGWAGDWFRQRVHGRALRPTCCVTYNRAAFFGTADGMPLRMTMDRDLLGLPASDWRVPHDVADGHPLLPDAVLLELKFHVTLPALYRDLLALLPVQQARGASKYRRCVERCGIWDGSAPVTAAAAAAPAAATPSPARRETA